MIVDSGIPARRGAARRRAERAWSRRAPAAADRAAPPGRTRRRLLGLVVVAAAVALATVVLHSRPFQLRHLVISGLEQASAAEVRADLQLPAGVYTWQLRPWTLARRLVRDPLIASARVRYLGTGTLSITIREHVPVVGVLQGTTLWELDRAGVVLRALPDPGGKGPVTVPGLGIPIAAVVGDQLGTVAPGDTLRSAAVQLGVHVAQSLGGAVASTAGTISLNGTGQVTVLTSGGIPVNYGDGLDARHKTAILLGILQSLGAQQSDVASIDLAAVATPALTLKPGSPPLHVNGVVTSG